MKPAYENPPAHAGEFTPDDFMYGASVSACSAEIQNGFLRKVYGLLSVQLLVTTAIGCWFMFHEQTRLFVTRTPSLLYLTFFASLGFLFACHCYKDKHPINLGLLGGFTLSIAYSVGVTCAVYQAHGLGYIVLQAFLLTAIITTALTTYTLRSKRDFSFLGAGLFGGLCALILGGLAHALIGWITGYGLGSGFSFVLALFGACIFSGYMCARARARTPPALRAAAPGHSAEAVPPLTPTDSANTRADTACPGRLPPRAACTTHG